MKLLATLAVTSAGVSALAAVAMPQAATSHPATGGRLVSVQALAPSLDIPVSWRVAFPSKPIRRGGDISAPSITAKAHAADVARLENEIEDIRAEIAERELATTLKEYHP
jgi:hypothetical protein